MADADISAPEVSGYTVSKQTYVYLITAGDDVVKIGVAKNVLRRLKGLQTGHYEKLSIAYNIGFPRRDVAYAVECRAHRLLKEYLMEGEWFAVSLDKARVAIEQAITDLAEERWRKQQESDKAPRYVRPEIIQAEPWMRDPIDAVSFLAKREGGLKKEYVIAFRDCVISVACRKDRRTGETFYMTNDVTGWYLRKEGQAA